MPVHSHRLVPGCGAPPNESLVERGRSSGYECPGVVRVPSANTSLTWLAFLLDSRFAELVLPLPNIYVGRAVTKLPDNTFEGAKWLKSPYLPGQVKGRFCDCRDIIHADLEICERSCHTRCLEAFTAELDLCTPN